MDALTEPGDHWDDFSNPGGYSTFHDVDTSAEVDAAFRSQRRIAVAYCVLFLVGVIGVAAVMVSSNWANTDGLLGGFSPSFLMTAVGLYLFFVMIAVAAASLANGVDERMMGASSLPERHLTDLDRQGDFAATRANGERSVRANGERSTR